MNTTSGVITVFVAVRYADRDGTAHRVTIQLSPWGWALGCPETCRGFK